MKKLLVLAALLLIAVGDVSSQAIRANNVLRVFTNDTTTGTVRGQLARVISASPNAEGRVRNALTTETTQELVLVRDGAGTFGSATVIVSGEGPCIMDANNASGAAGWWVLASTISPGRCHAQAASPSGAGGMVVGTMISDVTATGTAAQVLMGNKAFIPPSGTTGTGTVTQVALTMPSEFPVSGSPINTNGTFAVTKANQAAGLVFAGPASGAAAAPTFRALVATDIPAAPPGGTAGGDLAGTYPNPTVAKASGAFALPGETSVTLSGPTHNYPSCTSSNCRMNGGGTNRDVTGIDPLTTPGKLLNVCNVGPTNLIVLRNLNAGSSAANQFDMGGDTTLIPSACLALRYDVTSSKWRAISARPDYLNIRNMGVIVGDPATASPVLSVDNDSPSSMTNDYTRPVVVTSAACWGNDAGLVISIVLTGGASNSILTGNCTCGNKSWQACTINGAPIMFSFVNTSNSTSCTAPNAPCSADATIETTTGAARYGVVKMQTLLQ